MIYNMFTLTVQLLLTGFLVAVVFQRLFSPKGSRIIYLDLVLSILGAFLGTLVEAWLRGLFTMPFLVQLVLQFVLPILTAAALVLVYRALNQSRE